MPSHQAKAHRDRAVWPRAGEAAPPQPYMPLVL